MRICICGSIIPGNLFDTGSDDEVLGEECEGEPCEGMEELCEGGVEEEEEGEGEIEVLAGHSVVGRRKKKRKKLKTLTDKEKQSLTIREQVCRQSYMSCSYLLYCIHFVFTCICTFWVWCILSVSLLCDLHS